VLVGDNESGIIAGRQGSAAVMTEWNAFVRNQVRLREGEFAGPKLACIDLQPYTTTQAPDRSDIVNVGVFSDAVFGGVASFFGNEPARFASEVEAIVL